MLYIKERETFFKNGETVKEDLSVSSSEYIAPYLLNILYATANPTSDKFSIKKESSDNGCVFVITQKPLYDSSEEKTIIRITQINEYYSGDLYIDNPRIN